MLLLFIGVSFLVMLSSDEPSPVGSGFLKGAHVDGRVRAILVRTCSDCHSNDTRYPWYSALPILSRWIAEDVELGRKQLNLSEWGCYSRIRRMRALTGIANQVRDRAMPPAEYLLLHPSAKLSDREVDAVFTWSQAERLRLIDDAGVEPDVVK